MSKIQCRERNFYGCRPPVSNPACLRRPDPIPPRVEISARAGALFLYDESIALSAKWIDLEHVSAAAIAIRVDENLEVIIQVLTNIAAQFGGGDARRLRLMAINPEIDGMSGVDNAYFRFLRWRLTFVRLALPKISNGFGRLPNGII